MPRSRNEIVEEICLGWFMNSSKARQGILERIQLIERLAEKGLPDVKSIRVQAKRAQKALSILGDDFSPTVAPLTLPDVVRILAMRVVKGSGGAIRQEQAVEWLMDGQDGQTVVLPFAEILRREAYLINAHGPDRRFDYLHWLCMHGAVVLLKEFSDQQPVSTKDGNVHAIGQLLCEAITGDKGSKASGLRAAKAVLAWKRQERISA
jgi:hypothetical protein